MTCWLSHTLCFLPCKHEHPTHSRGTTQKIKVIAICTIADFFCCCCLIFISGGTDQISSSLGDDETFKKENVMGYSDVSCDLW